MIGAGAAEVHRIVLGGIEERRLEDAGGEDDLVELRRVIRVHGLRRHQPEAAIDRLSDPVELPLRVVDGDAHEIARVVVALDRHRAEVAPRVGPADLPVQRVQLGQRAGAVSALIQSSPLSVRCIERCSAAISSPMRAFASAPNRCCDEDLADDLAERIGARLSRHRVAAAHPPRPHLLLAAQHGAVEAELLLLEA